MPDIQSKPRASTHVHLVAVYGTLKSGFHNSYLLEGAKFLGEAKTFEKYPLVIHGLPYLLDQRGAGHHVQCELYCVSQAQLDRLDRLEGHPTFYRRSQIFVASGADKRLAWIYFLQDDRPERFKDRRYHKSYRQER